MIPVYFLVQMETWSKKNIIILIFSLVLLIVLIKYTNVSEIILADTGWATISETYADDDGVNPLRVLVYSIPAIFAVISQKYLRDEKEIVGILINLSFITSGLYVVAMFTSGIMIGRLPMYIQMHGYILLPYIIENNYSYKSRVIIYYVSIIFYLLYFYLMTRGIYYSSELTGFIY